MSDRGRPGGKRDKNLLRTSLGNGHRLVNRSEIGSCKSLAKELEKRIRKGCSFSSFLFFDSASLQALIKDGVFASFVKSENVRKYALKNRTEQEMEGVVSKDFIGVARKKDWNLTS